MIGMHKKSMMAAAAAGLMVIALSAPTAANEGPAADATAEQARAEVPMPKARPVPVRKRLAYAAPVRHVVRPVYYPYFRQERIAAHFPMLFLGVGF